MPQPSSATHSSVPAFHGFLPASRCQRLPKKKSVKNTAKPAAITNAPTVEIRLSQSHPISAG